MDAIMVMRWRLMQGRVRGEVEGDVKVANCFVNAGFFRPIESGHDDDLPDDDRTGSDLHDAVHKIAGQEAKAGFETFALAVAAARVVAPVTDAETIDTCSRPRRGRRARGRGAT
ncbi:hypothetical protein HPB48_002440 [Haemaphysalis longicornis]|uniref:Uncharacterized protein n=1 Tax=Haemaphysalis longicornis TaxID=44386 RepID=A0A9J6FBX7_HAELO|nr:hypothetical protein HPB48_002440 [Haemaphysalis longicornis]